MGRMILSGLEDIEGKKGSNLQENMVTQTTHYITERWDLGVGMQTVCVKVGRGQRQFAYPFP